MKITISASEIIKQRIPGLKLGLVYGCGASVSKICPEFETGFDELRSYLNQHYSEAPLSSNPVIGHVRRMYRKIGWEPTRYRPSSEALARRILQGKGLYRIFNLVDLGNLVSARYHLPMGLYDADKISGNILLDVGRAGESYQGIGKGEIHAEGKLILRDDLGIFGNPTADSKRTALEPTTKSILAIFFTPPEVDMPYLQQALDDLTTYYRSYVKDLEKEIISF
ncbi:B3/B4 domain-containing protein [Calditrichota bacterium LG25]